MIVNRSKMNHYSMIAWFFDMMTAQYAEKFPEAFQKSCDKNNNEGVGIDLRLTMDGNEIDVEQFFGRLEEHFVEELVKGVENEFKVFVADEFKSKINDIIEGSFDPMVKDLVNTMKEKHGIKTDNQTVS